MSRFFSSRFEQLKAYVPGEQPQDFDYVKLNTNESPYPPSKSVVKAISGKQVELLRLYSDPECKKTVAAIASAYGVKPENVVLGNGSDEILSFIFSAFCDADTPVTFPDISYGFYEVFAQLYGLKANVIPLCDDFTINPDDYCGVNSTVVIANPNAPTGLALSLDEVEKIVSSNPDNVVVIDEAYVDFGAQSAIGLIKKHSNVIVVQTFSKSRQLAGARLGMAFACEELIADLNTVRFSTNPYNVNRLSLLAGEAAVLDTVYFEKTRSKIIENRAYTVAQLEQRGFMVLNSKANFVFARHRTFSGDELYLKLKQNGVLVRHFTKERIGEYLRITIGTRTQMDALLAALDKIILT